MESVDETRHLPGGHRSDHHHDKGRIEALSDGVIAIAITLLIIEVGVPHVEEGQSLSRALWEQWPSYFGFALSFVAIGIMWMNHHNIFRDIDHADHTLVVINILVLMSISFLPFPTAVLAEYLRDDDFRLTATLLYGGTLVVCAVFFNALWLYVSHNRRLIDPHVTDAHIRRRTQRFLLGPVLYTSSLALALISPWISLWVYVILAVIYFLPVSED
jgi:uncharacterized membrane protein